jgi:glycine betaine/choline ABC-type transport system substrate-binding protein
MRRRLQALLLLLGLILGTGACGGEEQPTGGGAAVIPADVQGKAIRRNADNAARPPIVVSSKNFTEEFIVAEIYAQALEAAGYRIKKQLNIGSELIALKALRAGRIDAYPEYTGTALTTFFDVRSADVPKEPAEAYGLARAHFDKIGMTALSPTPFTDSNAFAMTREGAEKAGNITKISQLKGKSQDLTLSGSPECAQRIDCKLGLERVYGLKFAAYKSVDLAKRHQVLRDRQADVSVVFSTDGQIQAENLVVLQDDLQLLPPYNVTFVVRTPVLRAAGPDFANVIAAVNKGLTTEVMQELNSRVDVDKAKPAEVATQYLQEAGYVSS